MKNITLCLFIFSIFFSSLAFTQVSNGPIVLIVGTRPEAIKMIPVYQALKNAKIPTLLCSTGQHGSMLEEIFTLFDLQADFDLKIMKPGQDLFYITEKVLEETKKVFLQTQPRLVIVQGDTSSALAAALAAFYLKIPIAHVEAGLRTKNIYSPFPEEMNRQLLGRLATLHFAPTPLAVQQLQEEGVKKERIFCVGNTVIDALYQIKEKLNTKTIIPTESLEKQIDHLKRAGKKILLLTAHRRESLDQGLFHIFSALKTALNTYPNLYVIYPLHPNPVIKTVVEQVGLDKIPNMILTTPLLYHDMVYLLTQVDGVATDSGGIQEESVSLQNPTLVLRNETDRPEGLQDGMAILVGTQEEKILAGIEKMLNQHASLPSSSYSSPYGDGLASQHIVHIIQEELLK